MRSTVQAWTTFPETNFIGPVTGGPHYPHFQVRFYIEDIFLLELTAASEERLDSTMVRLNAQFPTGGHTATEDFREGGSIWHRRGTVIVVVGET